MSVMPVADVFPLFGVLEWWQLLALVVLIALIVFWKKYRGKQM